MEGVRIRAASPADIGIIAGIAQAAWPVAYATILSRSQLAYMLERMYGEQALREQMLVTSHRFFIAEANSVPIGFAGFEHGFNGEACTRLHKLYILPESKGTGIGRKLLDALESAARMAGDACIELNVNRFNPTKDWYLRRGFAIVRDEVIPIGNGYVMDDHVMVKRIG